MGLDLRFQILRFRPNTGSAGFYSLTVFDDGLQIDLLFGLGSDIGVAAGEAIHSSAAADGTCSGHRKIKTNSMSCATIPQRSKKSKSL